MITIDKAERLLAEARIAKCGIPGAMMAYPVETIAQNYNGIGPEWMPDSIREELTEFLPFFEPAAMIHDWQYSFDPRRDESSFLASNALLEVNARRLAGVKYPWTSAPIRRFFSIRAAKRMRWACDTFGSSAWKTDLNG